MPQKKLTAIVALAIVCFSAGCKVLELESDVFGFLRFTKIPLTTASPVSDNWGRATYVAEENENMTRYLYFTAPYADQSGSGRWVINDKPDSADDALAWAESWAVEPHLVAVVGDNSLISQWHYHDGDAWVGDDSFHLYCADPSNDHSIYFESSQLAPNLAGFYIDRTIDPKVFDGSPVLSLVPVSPNEPAAFMYKRDGKWMIGSEIGGESCSAYVDDAEANAPHEISSTEWHFVNPDTKSEFTWVFGDAAIYSHRHANPDRDEPFDNVFQATLYARSLKFIPQGQTYYALRNGIPMPAVGLGTGGLMKGQETKDTVTTAMRHGYRLFDLAQEYFNEDTIGEVLTTAETDETLPLRPDVFLESKVWPTDLGFYETSDVIDNSLKQLKSNYVDLFLIHWPFCDSNIDWMHCETTKDPDATWHETWRSLEKAYAEGRVNSIGVSNFNAVLLDEVNAMAVVRPHVVQNWAEVGKLDDDVRRWCSDNGAIYQPYASNRNLAFLTPEVSSVLNRVASEHGRTPHSVSLRFFLQTGAAVIPRSSKEEHIKENIDLFGYELTPEQMVELGWGEDLTAEL